MSRTPVGQLSQVAGIENEQWPVSEYHTMFFVWTLVWNLRWPENRSRKGSSPLIRTEDPHKLY